MDNPFIGQVSAFGFTYAPRNWAICSGQLLSISSNQALFALIGANYGGDARTNFGVPDLRGRTPVGIGQGLGMQIHWAAGFRFGQEREVMTVDQMPAHAHTAQFIPSGSNTLTVEVAASTDQGDSPTPAVGSYLADVVAGGGAADKPEKIYRSDAGSGTVPLGGVSVEGGASGVVQVNQTGGSTPYWLIQPGLGLNYSIALEGVFPPRN